MPEPPPPPPPPPPGGGGRGTAAPPPVPTSPPQPHPPPLPVGEREHVAFVARPTIRNCYRITRHRPCCCSSLVVDRLARSRSARRRPCVFHSCPRSRWEAAASLRTRRGTLAAAGDARERRSAVSRHAFCL